VATRIFEVNKMLNAAVGKTKSVDGKTCFYGDEISWKTHSNLDASENNPIENE